MIPKHSRQRCFQLFSFFICFFFFSISRYMPSDFWMESLVMKLTKFWMSDSLLDINLSMVCFLIMDLVSCLAWSVIKEWGQCFVLGFFKWKSTEKSINIIEFYQKITILLHSQQWLQSSEGVVCTVQHTWNSQPLGHRLCGCGDDLVFWNQLVHQSNL